MTITMQVKNMMDATLILSAIIRENRKLPPKGKFLLGRMHAALEPEFARVKKEYDTIVTSYNHKTEIANPAYNPEPDTEGNSQPKTVEIDSVPNDKSEDFQKRWAEIADVEIELPVSPININDLCLPADQGDGSITAFEFIKLGALISE